MANYEMLELEIQVLSLSAYITVKRYASAVYAIWPYVRLFVSPFVRLSQVGVLLQKLNVRSC